MDLLPSYSSNDSADMYCPLLTNIKHTLVHEGRYELGFPYRDVFFFFLIYLLQLVLSTFRLM